MGNSRLRVSSVLKYAFAWNVSGRLPIITGEVLSSAYSRVKGAFPTRTRRGLRRDEYRSSFHGQVFNRLGTTVGVGQAVTPWIGLLAFVTPWDMDAKRLCQRSWSVPAGELRYATV